VHELLLRLLFSIQMRESIQLRLATMLLLAAVVQRAQDLAEFQKKVTEFTLANGLHFILVERHAAPVVSFHTYIHAGSANDPSGQTGIARMVERTALNGTETIGTNAWADEKKAMDDVETAYDRLDAERNKGPGTDQNRTGVLGVQLRAAIDAASALGDPGELAHILQVNGATDVSSRTSVDSTEYACSLPSNRIELWFLMESQSLLHPVWRGFYKEREAALEDRRLNVESKALPKLEETMLATAFAAHPYRNPVSGWPGDVDNLRRSAAQAFFDRYYAPGNTVIAVVGDVNPADARQMAERYFGPMPARPLPPLIHTEEPVQAGPKTAFVGGGSQPLVLIGYKRPDQLHRDDIVLDVIQLILANGRTGLLYRELTQDKGVAQAQVQSTFPGGRYPNLFVFLLAPQGSHTLEESQKALEDLLARFESKPVDAETLARVKLQARAGIVRRLDNNGGLAALLPNYYASYGDWRKLFTALDDLGKITVEDVQRVAAKYFVPMNRTVVYMPQKGLP